MSDVETTGARGQTAAPISRVALGKLRAIGGHGPALAQADGLIDAFAEVFARIAASQPVIKQESVTDTDSPATAIDETSTQSDDDVTDDSGLVERGSEIETDTEQVIIETNQETTSVAIDTDDGKKLNLDDDADSSDELVLADESAAEEIDIAAIETHKVEQTVEEIEAPEVVAQEIVEDDETGSRRRDRRDSTAVAPTEKTDSGRFRGDRDTNPAEQLGVEGEELAPELDSSLEQTHDQGGEDSTRRVRGRPRYGGSENDDHQQVSQSQQTRSRQQPEAIRATGASDASIAGQLSQADSGPTQHAARNIESAVTNIQNVASTVSRSSTSGGVQGNSQTTARGTTHSLEPANATRDAAKAKPDTRAAKNDTAETVSRVKLIQRVSKAFQHLGPEGGVVRLRLAPAEMGSVRVEMRINQRKVQARVVAESEAASTALREHLPELRQRLESQGMQVERLEIETEQGETDLGRHSSHQGSDDSQTNRDWASRQRSSPNSADREAVSPQVSQPAPLRPAGTITPSLGGMDVRL